jgi:hypothetical protein
MQNIGYTILIILSAGLALSVGLLLSYVARIGLAIIRDTRSKRFPTRTLQHSELGTLTFEDTFWSGTGPFKDRKIQFAMCGDDVGPNAMLVEQWKNISSKLPTFEKLALEFTRVQEPSLAAKELRLASIHFLNPEKPDNFALEFELVGNFESWCVEFVQGQPKSLSGSD